MKDGGSAPVVVVHAVRPVDDLEQAFPVSPVLHPDLLLHAVAKLAFAGGTPQAINGSQVCLWDELHLQYSDKRSSILSLPERAL